MWLLPYQYDMAHHSQHPAITPSHLAKLPHQPAISVKHKARVEQPASLSSLGHRAANNHYLVAGSRLCQHGS